MSSIANASSASGTIMNDMPIIMQEIFLEDIKPDTRQDLDQFLASHLDFYGSGWLSDYDIKRKVGQGTFGEVLEAYHKQDQSHVALKRLIVENKQEGFPLTAMRELSILSELCHDNIIALRDHILDDNLNHYLVFDFCQQDLAGLLSCRKVNLSKAQQKAIMLQLFRGLSYLHGRGYVHRDIKAANILLAKNGTLKIADFGLARKVVIDAFDHLDDSATLNEKLTFQQNAPVYTSTVITRWYRPIELLISNSGIYDTPVDIWGAGCVMVELWTHIALLPGKNDMHQLQITIDMLGSISDANWPDFEKLYPTLTVKLPPNKAGQLDSYLNRHLQNDLLAIDLVKQCLRLDPRQRLDAAACTDHAWFHTEPFPGDIELLAQYGGENFEMLSNERRQKEHLLQQQQQLLTQPTALPSAPTASAAAAATASIASSQAHKPSLTSTASMGALGGGGGGGPHHHPFHPHGHHHSHSRQHSTGVINSRIGGPGGPGVAHAMRGSAGGSVPAGGSSTVGNVGGGGGGGGANASNNNQHRLGSYPHFHSTVSSASGGGHPSHRHSIGGGVASGQARANESGGGGFSSNNPNISSHQSSSAKRRKIKTSSSVSSSTVSAHPPPSSAPTTSNKHPHKDKTTSDDNNFLDIF